MKIDPAKFYSALTATAVVTVLAGLFVIKGYFEEHRARANSPIFTFDDRSLTTSADDRTQQSDLFTLWTPAEPNEVLNAAPDPGELPAAIPVTDGPQLIGGHRAALHHKSQPDSRTAYQFAEPRAPGHCEVQEGPSIVIEGDVAKERFAATESSEFSASDVGAPEALAAPCDATPIPLQPADDEATARELVEKELPGASREERNIWIQELKDLPENMVRDLLRLRRGFGSAVKFDVDRKPLPAAADRLDGKPADCCSSPQPETVVAAVGDPVVSTEDAYTEPWLESTLSAIEQARSVILNNIANANTMGFKRSTPVFADLPYQQIEGPAGPRWQEGSTLFPVNIGMGSVLAGTRIDLAQGNLRRTLRELDVAFEGDGFLQILGDGEMLFTRAGRLALTADRLLGVSCSHGVCPLHPSIAIPPESRAIRIDVDGTVSFQTAGSAEWQTAGQIETARFANPGALEPRGAGSFAASPATAAPAFAPPGEGGRGVLRQGSLEESNTNCAAELDDLKRLREYVEVLEEAAACTSQLSAVHARLVRKQTRSVRTVRPDEADVRRR